MKPLFIRYTAPGRLRIVPVNLIGWGVLAVLILAAVMTVFALTSVASFDSLGGTATLVAGLLGGLAIIFFILFNLSVPADQYQPDSDENA